MELQTLTNLLLATAIAHTGHSLLEPVNIRAKVARLGKHMDNQKVKEIPININSRPKAYLAALISLAVVFVPSWLIMSSVDPLPRTAMLWTIILVIVVEVINTVNIDKYHVEIEHLTRRFKK